MSNTTSKQPSKFYIKKNFLNLIEIVIALGLTVILLTSLFSCYRHLVISKIQIEKVRNQVYPHLLTQARLIQIFDSIYEGTFLKNNDDILEFVFDNGIDHTHKYCGIQKAKLYLDNSYLILEYGKPKRKEILQKGISTLSFSFFDADKRKLVDKWLSSTLPIQTSLHLDGETYTFSLPHVDHRAVYQQN